MNINDIIVLALFIYNKVDRFKSYINFIYYRYEHGNPFRKHLASKHLGAPNLTIQLLNTIVAQHYFVLRNVPL